MKNASAFPVVKQKNRSFIQHSTMTVSAYDQAGLMKSKSRTKTIVCGTKPNHLPPSTVLVPSRQDVFRHFCKLLKAPESSEEKTKARRTTSFRALCWIKRPALFTQHRPWCPFSSTIAPQRYSWEEQIFPLGLRSIAALVRRALSSTDSPN